MGDLRSLRDQGEAAWDAGQWELAQAAYAAIVRSDPDDLTALERNCWLFFTLGNSEKGLEHLRRLSDHHLDQQNPQAALLILNDAWSRFPHVLEIANDLGCLMIALGQIEEATEHFRRLGHHALDLNLEEAMEAFRRWDFLKRLKSFS